MQRHILACQKEPEVYVRTRIDYFGLRKPNKDVRHIRRKWRGVDKGSDRGSCKGILNTRTFSSCQRLCAVDFYGTVPSYGPRTQHVTMDCRYESFSDESFATRFLVAAYTSVEDPPVVGGVDDSGIVHRNGTHTSNHEQQNTLLTLPSSYNGWFKVEPVLSPRR